MKTSKSENLSQNLVTQSMQLNPKMSNSQTPVSKSFVFRTPPTCNSSVMKFKYSNRSSPVLILALLSTMGTSSFNPFKMPITKRDTWCWREL